MPRTPAPTARDATSAARRTHPSRRMVPRLTVCMLLIFTSFLALTGCSNLGEFDQDAIVQQAESYYESKYGAHVEVADVWEDRSYQLFGYRSSGRAFCTMEDGSTVLVDFEEGVLGDNRQQHEIVTAYEERLREAIEDATQQLESAGYTVSLVFINNLSPEADGFLEGRISTYTWQKNDDSSEESGSFFYARYSGSDRFFEQEAPRVSLGVPSIDIEISGRDAAFEHGFPMNAPARPSWVDPIDDACATLLPLTDNEPEVKVTVFQEGYRNLALMEDEPLGMLGELSPFDNMEPTGNWLIVDWIPLGKGVYITSDEPGVRLREGDVTLTEVEDAFSLEELVESGRLDERESRTYHPEAFATYQLEVRSDLFASAPVDVQDKGWFDVDIAYDNTDPTAGLAQLGVVAEELAPSLYTVRINPAAEDPEDSSDDAAASDDEPPLDVGIMRTDTLENGFQYASTTLNEDEPLLLARV
ncbi:hypothetical protein [Enorma sp.]|uniref:hypothetical protein n=1 Tax=Enorma sp. TaxID=1920692 RepID=UPI0025C4F4E6|nr:hypothetical protein [Enorma sp.]